MGSPEPRINRTLINQGSASVSLQIGRKKDSIIVLAPGRRVLVSATVAEWNNGRTNYRAILATENVKLVSEERTEGL